MYFLLFLLFFSFDFTYCKIALPYNQTRPSSKYDNPNFIRDRFLDEIWKPMMPESWIDRFRQPYHPAWMDYCDPYHCNDYHKIACGLNRKTMRFRWFQSECHIILNNFCSHYRGALKYDLVETKFCSLYVMYLREGCPSDCPDVTSPVCAVSIVDRHVILFKNWCVMNKANCRGDMLEGNKKGFNCFTEYEAIDMKICQGLLTIN